MSRTSSPPADRDRDRVTRATWRLQPAARNALLTLHVVAGVGWMGVDIALLVLVLTARASSDALEVVSAFKAVALIVPAVVPALSLAILATGLVLGLGTRWGLVRYWWVLGKLVMSLVMTALVFLSLVPAVSAISVSAAPALSADAVRASLGALPTMLLFPPAVSFTMLGAAVVLSVFKPWRGTPWVPRAK